VTSLADIDARLTRLMRGHEAIEEQTFFRLARPILSVASWRATIRADAMTHLLGVLRAGGDPGAALAAARNELVANVAALERTAIVQRRSPVAHAAWLRRVLDWLVVAERKAEAAARLDPSALLPPLIGLDPAGALEIDDVRIVDVELAAIDHLLAAARAETTLLGRRRSLLFAARQRLLEASAALPLERSGVRARARHIASEIVRIDRLQGAGVEPDVALVHQARRALLRREPSKLFAALAAIDENAAAAGDEAVAVRTRAVLAGVVERGAVGSLERSAQELLGDVADLVREAVGDARIGARAKILAGGSPTEHEAAQSLLDYLPDTADRHILGAALAADGWFEVGGALAPVRVVEAMPVSRVVSYPTAQLDLVAARDVDDVRDAVVDDPRRILLDLATGRLLTRRYVRTEFAPRPRTVMQSEARVYVLDGSGSMRGPRARVRDAILVAELSTLVRRLSSPRNVRATLLFRYFDKRPGPITRVDTAAAARAAIRDVVTNERGGGTDIQGALVASLSLVAEARAQDGGLARAQIVLVTDGAAPVDEAAIASARESLAGLPIGISVIALGQENPALRAMVARQRARGEAAFYHFLDDDELGAIVEGEDAGRVLIHAPERHSPEHLARILDEDAASLLDDLEALEREREQGAFERLEAEVQARRDLGVDEALAEGEHARLEALRRDRVALTRRFARWFPSPPETPVSIPPGEDVDAAVCLLASIAEIIVIVGRTELAREAEAIELLERMLPDARLSPVEYLALVRAPGPALADALRAVREAAAAG